MTGAQLVLAGFLVLEAAGIVIIAVSLWRAVNDYRLVVQLGFKNGRLTVARLFVREEAVKFAFFTALCGITLLDLFADPASVLRVILITTAIALPAIASLCSMRDRGRFQRLLHDQQRHRGTP